MRRFTGILILLALSVGGFSQSLKDYQQLAVEQNPSLMARYKAFEVAMTRVQQINALPDPTLSFGYFVSPVETRVGPQRARFSLTQMFPWFGTLRLKGMLQHCQQKLHFNNLLMLKIVFNLRLQKPIIL